MPNPRTHHVTQALGRLRDGEAGAADELLKLVYDDLHRVAERSMRRERRDHTLQATALVNEVWIKLCGSSAGAGPGVWNDRAHFIGIAARAIRQILVDWSREHGSLKRGGDRGRLELSGLVLHEQPSDVDLLELDGALRRLAQLDERQVRVVEMRFFGGLSVEEVAEVLGVSNRTVKSDWQVARLWLKRDLAAEDDSREPD